MIGVKPNEPGSAWRFKVIRPWLRFWTGVFLRLGLGFWGANVTGWEHFQEAERERCCSPRFAARTVLIAEPWV